ncbi:MAG TPA: fumarylacetoacetase [Gemmatales bacterium]|nr:fumarylacetoacetase [Gemmatales bacterium]
MLDATHDPQLTSWVESAQQPGTDFPIQNLPLGVFRPHGEMARIGVAIGDAILDVSDWLPGSSLNSYCAMPPSQRRELRGIFSKILSVGSPELPLFQQSACEMLLPLHIGDYTDFYASIDHATNVGRMFRPDNPLLPNYRHIPIAYHGRSSTVLVSGTCIRRPLGQLSEGKFGPCSELDYEVELGVFIGPGNHLGEAIPIAQASEHLVGLCLLNDWSARDIQRWEYQPLGPFLAKNFATSISPWMVTLEALEPFRVAPPNRDPAPLPYLQETGETAFDIAVECYLQTSSMQQPVKLSQGSFRTMFWTISQMLAHHASNGCLMRPGDLLGTGTISGPQKHERGCLLELTWKGTEPLQLPTGETRRFLENGDTVLLKAYCQREGFTSIGFGICLGQVTA